MCNVCKAASYHKKKKAFSGKEMSPHLLTMLRGGMGDGIHKLRYLKLDGCPVNHVARVATEKELKEIYDRYDPIGSEDTENLCKGVCLIVPAVRELPCFRHLVNLIARDAMMPYREKSFIKFRNCFAHLFYSGGKPSAKKGKYTVQAMEELLGAYDSETNNAITFFKQ